VIVEAALLIGGIQRHYLLVRPSIPPEGRPALVIVLHGHMGGAAQALGLGRVGRSALALWPKLAESDGFLVAAPDGLKGRDRQRGWNDCRSDAINNPVSDDVAFLDALAARLIKEENADPRRIYVTGMSNGALMALRAALEMSPAPAAVAAISGGMAAKSACGASGRPVSVLLVNGTADPLVPYGGGGVGYGFWPQDRGTVLPVDDAAVYWRRVDGLSGEPHVDKLPHADPDDPTSVTRSVWGDDPAKPQVELVRVEGGGHVEPSRAVRAGPVYRLIAGRQNRDFETAEEAWAFFKDKRAP